MVIPLGGRIRSGIRSFSKCTKELGRSCNPGQQCDRRLMQNGAMAHFLWPAKEASRNDYCRNSALHDQFTLWSLAFRTDPAASDKTKPDSNPAPWVVLPSS